MDIQIEQKRTLTIFRTQMLKNRVESKYNLIAGGTPRGGTSILGLLMKIFNFEMGDNIHPDKYEDLDLHNVPVSEWSILIQKKTKDFPDWSVKYPAVTRHLKLFSEACPNPVFLIIIRNPFTVAKSMIKHDETYTNSLESYTRGMEIALDSYKEFNSQIKNINAPFIVLEHEKIIKEPKIFMHELIEVLNIKTDKETINNAVELISVPGYKEISGALS